MKFKIPEENLHKLDKIIGRINKRAKKLNLPPVDMDVGTPTQMHFPVETESLIPQFITTRVFPITLTGENPILSGWRFLGKLDHLPGTDDNIVLGNEVPEKYHSCPPNCDHCSKERNRAETFILKKIESGEVQQVGTSCLKDFFNSDDPMQHAGFLQFLVRVQDELTDLEEPGLGNGQSHYRDAIEILTVANTYVRSYGFLSASAAEGVGASSTGQLVREALTVKGSYPKNVSDDDRTKAHAVLKWLKSDEFVSSKGNNEYLHNLATLAAAGVAKTKYIAILASAVVAYDRALEKARIRENEVPSDYVGVKGERLPLTEITIAAKITIAGDRFGDKMLYIMRDNEENRLNWFCTGNQIGSVGDKLHITGMVSEHDVYKGQKQTTLKRVVALENKLVEAVKERRDVKVINKLLSDPVNIDHRYSGSPSDGMTALMEACLNGDREVAEILLSKGANPDIKDLHGFTAAHHAAKMAHIGCLETLNDWGADFTFVARRMELVTDLLAHAQEHIAKIMAYPRSIPDRPDLKEMSPSQMYERSDIRIADLGPSKGWIEYIQGARARAEVSNEYFQVPREDIILEETEGKLSVVYGHLQVAQAAELKIPMITAYVIGHQPKAIVELINSQMTDSIEDSPLNSVRSSPRP